MSQNKPSSEVENRYAGKPAPITWQAVSGALTDVLNNLPAAGYASIALPSNGSPNVHPSDARDDTRLWPYVQALRENNGAFAIEVSSNAYLRGRDQLNIEQECELVARGWSPPNAIGENHFNFHRETPDANAAAGLIVQAIERCLGVPHPGMIVLADCGIAGQPPEPGDMHSLPPITDVLTELLDEARFNATTPPPPPTSPVSPAHERNAFMASNGAPVPQPRDTHAAQLAHDGIDATITLLGDRPGFEVELAGGRGPIAVWCEDADVVLTIVLSEPEREQQEAHLAALLLALNDSTLNSTTGTTFTLADLVTIRRRVRDLQPEHLIAELQSFAFEAREFGDCLAEMLKKLG